MRPCRLLQAVASSSPEVLEPCRRQLGVPHGVLDIAVTEIGLQGADVVALVGQREAAGVAQHVRVHLERHPGFGAGALRPKPSGAFAYRARSLAVAFA